MVLLIDANVVLDYLLKREPFYEDSKGVIEICSRESVRGYIALHTVATLWYLLRDRPEKERREGLRFACSLLRVTGAAHEDVVDAINEEDFRDFEDCLQVKCAKTVDANYIVTRNPKDFILSEIPVLTSRECVKMFY